ncbi:uncharacterized protein LOC142520310 [Primulina tabacum]|uniref:uncharacterized protein LOC142520310 n=1 Tax=Primulina tabacum TaxID=48773 RepID=UPI003F5A1357
MERYRAQLIIGELEYNPKIEKTTKRLRKEARLRREKQPSSSSPDLDALLHSDDTERESDVDLEIERIESDQEEMAGQAQRKLKELGNPNVIQQPLCIQYPTTDATFELKSGLIHLLPTFRGLAASRAANIRKDICAIRQLHEETLYEYWERFKQLCASCPQHQIPEQLLGQYFYEGLSLFDRNMIDAASGDALVNKTPQEARALISNMAANAQQFRSRQDNPPRQVNEEDPPQQVNAIDGFPGQPQRRYDPYSNSFNPGWKDHPNFSYRNQGGQQGYPQKNYHKHPSPAQASNSGNIPSQTVVNPRENVSAITLRNCKELDVQQIGIQASAKQKEDNMFLQSFKKLFLSNVVIQFADRSTVYPRGVIEDVLVKVENLVFPADFYVLDMEKDVLNSQILLGRLFLKTSKSVIDVNSGTLTMEFDGEIVKFNIYDTMKYPVSESTINTLDLANQLSQENSKIVDKNNLEEIIERPVENYNIIFSLSDSQTSKIA